ncbi:MAG TPA: hypothetical protein VGH03_06965 [Caulobacteraceae bacterium]|jgi:hypothetical protein
MSRTLRAFVVIGVVALIQFCAYPKAEAASAVSIHKTFLGVELPRYGREVKVLRLFHRPNGGIVVKYSYRNAGALLVDYYDIDGMRRLAPQIEAQLAQSNELGFQLEKSNGLKPILPMPRLDLGGHVIVEEEGFAENGCSWPYRSTFAVISNGKIVSTASILVRLQSPARREFGCAYEADIQPPAAMLKYGNPPVSLYPDGRGGFYGVLFDLPYVIHFDHSGKSGYFLRRRDLIEMPSTHIDPIASKATSLPPGASWQPTINEAERLIDRAATAQ